MSFEPGGGINFDNRIEMQDELAEIFGRKVDLVEKEAIRNPFRRHEYLDDQRGRVCRLGREMNVGTQSFRLGIAFGSLPKSIAYRS